MKARGKRRPGIDIGKTLAVALGHHQAGRLDDAERCYRAVLDRAPGNADALHLLGALSHQRGDAVKAITLIERAIAKLPAFPEAHNNLGAALADLGRHEDAASAYRQATLLKPTYAQAHANLGHELHLLGRRQEAIAALAEAVRLAPNLRTANDLGNVLLEVGRVADAIACYRDALARSPECAELWHNLSTALIEAGQLDAAESAAREAVTRRPALADSWYNLGAALQARGRHVEAIAAYEHALNRRPDFTEAAMQLLQQKRSIADWEGTLELERSIIGAVESGARAVAPFHFLCLDTSPTAQLSCARRWTESRLAAAMSAQLPGDRTVAHSGRLRIGYLSSDFHDHATAHLAAELFELHDRTQFQLRAYSYGPDDESAMRKRLVKAFDVFRDIAGLCHADAAQQIRDDGIDILVDLKGHTQGVRLGIAARRPAPVQVAYLGYPGTTGAPFFDYALVDAFVTPFSEHQPHFSERLVYLPGCYQANDRKRPVAAAPSRAECGLPEQRFVFCSFNHPYKITPAMFGIWMRLLWAVPESVLWLLAPSPEAAVNLRREASARGVDPARLISSPRVPQTDHLARFAVADLFLDTFPVNAHTTASDSLWGGCPVLTCAGGTFVSRVAGSLLCAAGMPEMIAGSLEEYERLAVELATTGRERLAAIRHHLAGARGSAALFDTPRLVRALERAYEQMAETHSRGQSPAGFSVRL